MSLPDPPVLVITDRHQSRMPLPALAAAVFEGGGRWLLLRDKDLAQAERIALARLVIDIAAPFGATVLMSGDVEAAIVHYRSALALKPNSAVIHGNLGSLLAQGGRLDEAIVEFRRALELEPDYEPARRHLEQALALVRADP